MVSIICCIFVIEKETNINMEKKIEMVNDLMSKYGLTKKDLFSFCICAVNFLEYYLEEAMCDVMWNCPDRYYNADSDNTKAVAGALNGEKKEEGWTDEEQFYHYMKEIQSHVEADINNLFHFLSEFDRFEKVYKREVFVPIMLGCPVEDYDDSKFYDKKYLKSIANADNLTLCKMEDEKRAELANAYKEREATATAKEVEERKNDEDFSILLASPINVNLLQNSFEEYNKKYYPDRDYKVVLLNRPEMMIIQTGGKSIENAKDRIIEVVKKSVTIVGRDAQEELLPIDQVFNVVPMVMKDYKVTHAVIYA